MAVVFSCILKELLGHKGWVSVGVLGGGGVGGLIWRGGGGLDDFRSPEVGISARDTP